MPKNISDEDQAKFTAALKDKGDKTGSGSEGSQTRQVENPADAADKGGGDKGKEQKPAKTPEEIQKEFDDYKSGESTRYRAEQQKFLEAFALESPEHWKHVYGPDVPPPDGLFDEDKGGKGKGKEEGKADGEGAEEDPKEKRLAALEKREQDRMEAEALETLSDRIEGEMARHDDVFSKEKNPLGPQLVRAVVSEVRRNPKADLKKVVDDVATSFKEFEKKQQEKYVGGKTQVAESIPAGAGKSGGAQAGAAPTEYDFSKRHGAGSMREGLAAALRQANAAGKAG